MTNAPELQTGIDRTIYGMPAFASLATPELEATVDWFTTALGFEILFAMPPGDEPMLVHLRRWRYQDILVRRAPQPLHAGAGWSVTFAAEHDELDGLAARARAHGAGTVHGPADTTWNTTDVVTVSPDGVVVVFTARRPEDRQDEAFSADMSRWSAEQGLG